MISMVPMLAINLHMTSIVHGIINGYHWPKCTPQNVFCFTLDVSFIEFMYLLTFLLDYMDYESFSTLHLIHFYSKISCIQKGYMLRLLLMCLGRILSS